MQETSHAPLPRRRGVWLKREYPVLLRILTRLALNAEPSHKNEHLRLCMRGHTAEAQYALLTHYYKVAGVIEHRAGRSYRPLKAWERQEILRLHMQGVPKLHIAQKLGRHISTVFYFLRREKLSVEHEDEGSIPSDSIAHAYQEEQGQEM